LSTRISTFARRCTFSSASFELVFYSSLTEVLRFCSFYTFLGTPFLSSVCHILFSSLTRPLPYSLAPLPPSSLFLRSLSLPYYSPYLSIHLICVHIHLRILVPVRCFIPALFVAAEGDEFVPPHHRYHRHTHTQCTATAQHTRTLNVSQHSTVCHSTARHSTAKHYIHLNRCCTSRTHRATQTSIAKYLQRTP
jgi:hypothetical protein